MKKESVIMKKVLVLFISVLMICTLAACGEKQTNSNTDGQSTTRTQSETTGQNTNAQNKANIKITPPAGWNPVEGSTLPVHYMKNTTSFMIKEEGFLGNTVDEIVPQVKASFEGAFENVSYIGDAKKITVDGIDARQIVFTCSVSGLDMKYEYVYLLVGGDLYAITFGDMGDTFDDLSADYAQILKDIKFK
jgi:predicted small lipoprotein YifL